MALLGIICQPLSYNFNYLPISCPKGDATTVIGNDMAVLEKIIVERLMSPGPATGHSEAYANSMMLRLQLEFEITVFGCSRNFPPHDFHEVV
jgi:hypothetical protein